MKHIPILFSTEMVQAILDGRKTLTRRITGHDLKFINKTPNDWRFVDVLVGNPKDKCDSVFRFHNNGTNINACCPYGQPGDILWVREKFVSGYEMDSDETYVVKDDEYVSKTWYAADRNLDRWFDAEEGCMTESIPWKPGIHMPKTACRIFLEVVSVKVERLQEISEQDAIAEGVQYNTEEAVLNNRKNDFMKLWQSINGSDSWDANPWIWVILFKRVEKPVDFIPVEESEAS